MACRVIYTVQRQRSRMITIINEWWWTLNSNNVKGTPARIGNFRLFGEFINNGRCKHGFAFGRMTAYQLIPLLTVLVETYICLGYVFAAWVVRERATALNHSTKIFHWALIDLLFLVVLLHSVKRLLLFFPLYSDNSFYQQHLLTKHPALIVIEGISNRPKWLINVF